MSHDVELKEDLIVHASDEDHSSDNNSHDGSHDHLESNISLIVDDHIHDDETSVKESPPLKSEKKGTAVSVAFNLINTTVGAGILALPFAFRELGVLFGSVALLIMGIIAGSTLYFLSYTSNERKKFSYKELAVDVFGTKIAGVIFELTIVIVGLGSLISYLIIIGQFTESLFGLFLDSVGASESTKNVLTTPALLIAILLVFIIFPLSSLRRIHFLSYSSLLSIVSAAFVVVSIVIRCIEKGVSGQLPGGIALIGTFDGIMTAFPIICFSLTSHVTLLPMINEMKSPSVRKVGFVGAGSVSICVIMYMTIAIAGYILFQDKTQDNVLNSFEGADLLILVAKVSITMVVILSYPLFLYSTRDCFENIFFSERPFSWIRWLGLTAVICIVTYIIAVVFPSIKSVLGLSGATGSTLAAFVYPSIIYFKIVTSRKQKAIAGIMILIAGAMGILSTVTIIIDIVKSYIS